MLVGIFVIFQDRPVTSMKTIAETFRNIWLKIDLSWKIIKIHSTSPVFFSRQKIGSNFPKLGVVFFSDFKRNCSHFVIFNSKIVEENRFSVANITISGIKGVARKFFGGGGQSYFFVLLYCGDRKLAAAAGKKSVIYDSEIRKSSKISSL